MALLQEQPLEPVITVFVIQLAFKWADEGTIRANIMMGYKKAECWSGGEKREKKRVVSLQPVSIQELRNFVKETSWPYINDKELNHYTSRLRDELQRFLQPAMGQIISLALTRKAKFKE